MSGIYVNIDSVGRKITQVPVIIDGVERNTKTGYACVDGVGREFFGGGSVSGTPLNDYPVGTPVYLNVNGVRTSFILAHKGRPSTNYDSSCDGMWLVMNNIYEKRQWHSNNNSYTSYANTTIHSYLKNTFLNLLDSKIKNVIKTVKIPYTKFVTIDSVTGEPTSPHPQVNWGVSGLSTKIFLLSSVEVGLPNYSAYEGSRLDYFNTTTSRIGYYNGTATMWYLRTPNPDKSDYSASVVLADGNRAHTVATSS